MDDIQARPPARDWLDVRSGPAGPEPEGLGPSAQAWDVRPPWEPASKAGPALGPAPVAGRPRLQPGEILSIGAAVVFAGLVLAWGFGDRTPKAAAPPGPPPPPPSGAAVLPAIPAPLPVAKVSAEATDRAAASPPARRARAKAPPRRPAVRPVRSVRRRLATAARARTGCGQRQLRAGDCLYDHGRPVRRASVQDRPGPRTWRIPPYGRVGDGSGSRSPREPLRRDEDFSLY